MSLYAIGDLHLHFQSELKAKNQIEDNIWKNHETAFFNNCKRTINAYDTLVLAGDHSWGKNIAECKEDLDYIANLPGRKIMIRGNHDMFWDVKKTGQLNEMFKGRLEFLQNNYFPYEDYALVGTKGYTFEGPFYLDRYGNIQGWDEKEAEHAEKLVKRESERLIASFEAAKADGYKKFIMFLHYPPTNIVQSDSIFTKIAEQYGAEQVVYGHCHGERRFHDSIIGKKHKIRYSLVSGDFLRWKPFLILKG